MNYGVGIPTPHPNFRRVMVFIDGENLVFRFQQMIASSRRAAPNVVHKKDVFVWTHDAVRIPILHEIERATFYTYTSGDNSAVDIASNEIRALSCYPPYGTHSPTFMSPRVFSKPKERSGKGVDIQMTVDILTHAYQDNFDILYLVSGDGDYCPVIEEVIRRGKRVYVAALSSGLSPALQKVADAIVNLDDFFLVG